MRTVGNILTVCTLLTSLFLLDCSIPVAGGTDTGNPVIAGILYNPNGSRAANAKVRAIPVDHNPISELENRITAIDSTFTNDSGEYTFDSLPDGYYNIFGEGDSGLSYNDSFFVLEDTANVFPDDTLENPGTLRGVVRLQPGDDSRTVIILMFGTKTWEAPIDSIGNFSLPNMAAGAYHVRFLTTLNNYDPLDMQLTIKAGVDSMMPDTIRLTYTGVPIPYGLTSSYDTLNGLVNLSWNALNFPRLEGYFVYRNDTSSTIPVIISGVKALKDTFYIDTIFTDPMDTNNFIYKYRLKSQDTNAVMSEKYSNSVEVFAVSPTKVKTFLILSSYSTVNDTASINDTVKVVVNFSNETRKNTNIYWYVDTSDSIVRQVDIDTLSGSDTLQWSWSEAGSHLVSVKIKDIAGSIWEGNITIQIIQDPPIVNAGNDTTVSIYDTIRLHGSASDSFGQISKWEWDFGNTGTFITTSTSDTNIVAPASEDTNYQCVLRVTDDDSNTVKDTVRIIVLQDVPVPNAGPDTTVRINSPATLSGTAAQQFGTIVMYKWDFDGDGSYDDSSASTPSMTYTYTHEASYNAIFYVRDDDGNNSTDVRVVTVQNSAPVITSIRADTTISIQDSIQLTASAVDSDGNIIEYAWDYDGDGTFDYTSATQSNTGYRYTTVGTYNAIFRVTDDDNKQSFDTAVITVLQGKPYVNLGNDTTVSINDTVRINGTVTDSLGTIISIQWSIGGSGFVLASSPDTTFVAPSTENLNYLCIIRVVDDDDNLVFDTLVVRVETDPPIAVITAPDTARVDSFFTLSSDSSSPGNFGTLVKYEWSINAYNDFKETSGNDTTIFTDTSEIDSFIVVLRVTDDDGNIDYDTAYIVICRIWEPIGIKGFSDGAVGYTSIAFTVNNAPIVGYSEEEATVMIYSGILWEAVGNKKFSDSSAYDISLGIDKNDIYYIGFKDMSIGGRATVMKYNGVSWEAVGYEGLRNGFVDFVSLAIDSNNVPHVGYADHENDSKATVMKFNGTTWDPVGIKGFSDGYNRNLTLLIDGNNVPWVAYQDQVNDNKPTVMKYNGTAWEVVGIKGFSDVAVEFVTFDFDGNNVPYVAYKHQYDDNKVSVMKYNGTAWELVGIKGISDGSAQNVKIAIDKIRDIPYVGYTDNANNNRLTVMKFNGTAWVPIGRKGFSDGRAEFVSFAINKNSIPHVAYQDGGWANRIVVLRYR